MINVSLAKLIESLNAPRIKGQVAFLKERTLKNVIVRFFTKMSLMIKNRYLLITSCDSNYAGYKKGDIIHISGSTYPEYNGKFIVRVK